MTIIMHNEESNNINTQTHANAINSMSSEEKPLDTLTNSTMKEELTLTIQDETRKLLELSKEPSNIASSDQLKVPCSDGKGLNSYDKVLITTDKMSGSIENIENKDSKIIIANSGYTQSNACVDEKDNKTFVGTVNNGIAEILSISPDSSLKENKTHSFKISTDVETTPKTLNTPIITGENSNPYAIAQAKHIINNVTSSICGMTHTFKEKPQNAVLSDEIVDNSLPKNAKVALSENELTQQIETAKNQIKMTTDEPQNKTPDASSNVLESVVDGGYKKVKEAGNLLKEGQERIKNAVGAYLIENSNDIHKSFPESLKEKAVTFYDKGKSFLSFTIDIAQKTAVTVMQKTEEKIASIIDLADKKFTDATTEIADSNIIKTVKAGSLELLETAQDTLSTARASNMAQNIGDTVKTGYSALHDAVEGTVTTIKSAISQQTPEIVRSSEFIRNEDIDKAPSEPTVTPSLTPAADFEIHHDSDEEDLGVYAIKNNRDNFGKLNS